MDSMLFWRSKLGCEFLFLTSVTEPEIAGTDAKLTLIFIDTRLDIEVEDDEAGQISKKLRDELLEGIKKSQQLYLWEKEYHKYISNYQQFNTLRTAEYETTMKQEQLYQLCSYLSFKESYTIIEKITLKFNTKVLNAAFKHWMYVIKDLNNDKMFRDRSRWRLHASANQDIDLQAWYHALFYLEVYRLRGHFWYKDAVLPVYKQSYDLVDNALTPLEEAALAHVLCSPDTSYGDVAGQMFVVQALIPANQFSLFQQLAAQGSQVTKYPRSGRPAKKLFRFSFVEGNIYLTWKGKFGNQGVGMGEVTSVVGGIQTDVLKYSGQASKQDHYLSVICSDRSVDLYFDSEEERNNWRDLLKAIVTKEQGQLIGVESIDPQDKNDIFEWLVLYASIGKKSEFTMV